MSNLQHSNWYGSDGMSSAYDFSMKRTHGNCTIEEEEKKKAAKAQRLLNNKASKHPSTSQNTALEDEAITRFGSSASTPTPTQKHGRESSIGGESQK